jgi:NAD(P)-dependent dehydrogenase (short-subunit alcohol dehydrogenase family)
MKAQRWGRIINMCSLAGVNAFMGTVEYNSAKEALRTLTRTAAREWAPFGIVANVICPGAKGASLRRLFEARPEMERAMAEANPMRRIGDPEAGIGPVAAFLASEDARHVTGNTLFATAVGTSTVCNGSPTFDRRQKCRFTGMPLPLCYRVPWCNEKIQRR